MSETTVLVPARLGLGKSLEFVKQIQTLRSGDNITFDFTKMNFVGPFGFLMVSSAIQDLVRRMQPDHVFAVNYNMERHSYHAHMGFFKAFGLEFGNSPGQAKGSKLYLPITINSVIDIHRESAQSGLPIGEVVEGRAGNLARILACANDGELVNMFTYSLREIIRNVAEHSESKVFEYCAQYWPSQDRAEIAILDKGVGIYNTLKNNPYLQIEDQRHAINLALLPGVSGKGYKGAKQKHTQEGWHNSGYGLYMTSRMCRNGGNFFIGSMDSALYLDGDKKEYMGFNFKGTVVRMVFKPSSIKKIQEVLAIYMKEGAETARTIQGTIVTPSAASQMLTSDFHGK